jgi:hypothetical protein
MQVSILAIFSCQAGESQPAEGARRTIRDMRAQLLISIPMGQGRQ